MLRGNWNEALNTAASPESIILIKPQDDSVSAAVGPPSRRISRSALLLDDFLFEV